MCCLRPSGPDVLLTLMVICDANKSKKRNPVSKWTEGHYCSKMVSRTAKQVCSGWYGTITLEQFSSSSLNITPKISPPELICLYHTTRAETGEFSPRQLHQTVCNMMTRVCLWSKWSAIWREKSLKFHAWKSARKSVFISRARKVSFRAWPPVQISCIGYWVFDWYPKVSLQHGRPEKSFSGM